MLPLSLQRPEAWLCGKCGKARINAEGQLIVAPMGSLCAACAADGKEIEAAATKVAKEPKAAKTVKVKGKGGDEKQLSLTGK
jgi:hypothetical protein